MKKNLLIRLVFAFCLALAALSANAKDIVIYYNGYFLACDGTNIAKITNNFNPQTCIWEWTPFDDDEEKGTIKAKNYQKYLSCTDGRAISLDNSFANNNSDKYWRYSDGGSLYLYLHTRILWNDYYYYIYFNIFSSNGNASFSNTQNQNNNNVNPTVVKGYALSHIDEVVYPTQVDNPAFNVTISPTSATLEYQESQDFAASDVNKTITYTTPYDAEGYHFSNLTYYKNEAGNFSNSNPAHYDVVKTETFATSYTWSVSANPAVAFSSSDREATATYQNANLDATTTCTVTVTATSTNSYSGTETSSASATVTLNKFIPTLDPPTVEISREGLVTITHEVPGVSIYYTLDGSIPTNGSSLYTGPFNPGLSEYKLNAVAYKEGYYNSAPSYVEYPEPKTGVYPSLVILNDWEDLSWTYYTGIDDNFRDTYSGTLYAPNARNIVIEYQGGGVDGASDVAISGIVGEEQNVMRYYSTLECGADGKYPYTVIPNPFSKRPRTIGASGTNGYYGFAGWKIIEGADKIDGYDTGDILPLEADINFVTGLVTGDKIVFEAAWTPATVLNKNSIANNDFNVSQTYSKSEGTKNSYETNFLVLNANRSSVTFSKSLTIMSKYNPDGTTNGNYNFQGGGPSATNTGTLKLEYINITGAVTPNGRNIIIGRGVTTTTNGVSITCASGNNTVNQTVRIESGVYSTFVHYGSSQTAGSIKKQHIILGCDYDRAKNDNDKLEIKNDLYIANNVQLNLNRDQEICRVYSKSGRFFTSLTSMGDGEATQSYYFSIKGTHNKGLRYLEIQGGIWPNIAGGICENQDPAYPAVIIRMKGGIVQGSIYGAGAFAPSAGIRKFVITGGEIYGWVAAGCNGIGSSNDRGNMNGDSYLYIGGKAKIGYHGLTINSVEGGNVFGAGRGRPTANNENAETTEIGTVKNSNIVVADSCKIEKNVYGGGNYGRSLGDAKIYVAGGTVDGAVFGGSNMTPAVRPDVKMYGGSVYSGVYGGCNNEGNVKEDAKVSIFGGQVGRDYAQQANVCGGGLGAKTSVTGNVDVLIGLAKGKGPTIYGDVYGGSQQGKTNTGAGKATTVTMNGGWIKGSRFSGGTGGGLFGGGLGDASNAADVGGTVTVTVNGGNVEDAVYGCNNTNGKPAGAVTVTVNGTDPRPSETTYAINGVFGGGNRAAYTAATPTVTVNNCDSYINYVYGGANATSVPGTDVTINGGTLGHVFGGGKGVKGSTSADVTGATKLEIYGGNIGEVYGGGDQACQIGANNITVLVNEKPETTCPVYIGDIFGGGNQADYNGSTLIDYRNGTHTGSIYGGGALADVTGSATVSLTGGTVNDVYGGALGSDADPAYVNGDASVTLDGSRVTGSIFGANNVNGTPKGHVKVHVVQTVDRIGQQDGEFDVPAVYGGGNQAAYAPDLATDFAEVIVDGCETSSIEYVYGGGNAAPVPETKVYILGADSIGHVFGGGNGAGEGNPGANVGYKNKLNNTDNPYGNGTTLVNLYGGHIGEVFGGSNTKGLIKTSATVNIDGEGTFEYSPGVFAQPCSLVLGEVYSAGNEAPIECPTYLNINCVDELKDIYGGSRDADVGTVADPVDVVLNIVSGKVGRVFGGNNVGHTLHGTITVNIDETGCKPLIIGEVFGCGNNAAYATPAGKHDPVVNIISCTEVGAVYGGGLGAGAVVTGNPTVNVQQIPGRHGEGKLGQIGSVYGGGKEAPLDGKTTVNIATEANQPHVTGTDLTTPAAVGANITGNVFGGGKEAEVSGTTNVVVGQP